MAGRDTRRIPGPEKCMPYTIFQPKEKKSFLGQDGMRVDGRSAIDPRKLFVSVGIISQAKGSSYLEVGNTKVCCGVYGPKDIQRGHDFKMTCQVLCEVQLAPFSCIVRRSPQPDKRQRDMCRQLKEALESVIVLLWHGGIIYADPSRHEEENESSETRSSGTEGGLLTIGMMPNYANGQVSLMLQEGQISADNLCEGLDLAVEMCQRIYTLCKKTLEEYVDQALEDQATITVDD